MSSVDDPPEGHTPESWAAMRRASQALRFGAVRPPISAWGRDLGVEIPDVPTVMRDGSQRVRVPTMTYVIRCGAYVKIGTTSDVRARLRTLEASNPLPLTVVAVLIGGQALERSLHRRFAAYRHHDEWFHEQDDLAAWIVSGCPVSPSTGE